METYAVPSDHADQSSNHRLYEGLRFFQRHGVFWSLKPVAGVASIVTQFVTTLCCTREAITLAFEDPTLIDDFVRAVGGIASYLPPL